MKRLITNESLAYVGHLKNLLEQSGITCLIRNDQLSGGLGEIPFLDCLPELWVARDEDLTRAEAVLEAVQNAPAAREEWRCNLCGENNEGQFALCWQCGGSDIPVG
jgi:hypothetical protein